MSLAMPPNSPCSEPGGGTCRASSSTGCPVVQSTTRDEGTAGSWCADARICQEILGSVQASGPTPNRLHMYGECHQLRDWPITIKGTALLNSWFKPEAPL
eukprot:9030845-Pyramimonas_sp.AAC.1